MGILYHYTDLNAFLNIMQKRKLWLTGAHNLNDSQEINWTHQKIHGKLNHLAASHGREKPEEIWHLLQASAGIPYICSLSSEPDLLSQWRAYGQNGTGVAIGFNRSSLPSTERLPILTVSKKDSISLQQVVYDEKIQSHLIDSILLPAFQGGEIDDQAHIIMSTVASQLAALSSTFKNPAFAEEHEWRIIHRPLILGNNNNLESRIDVSISLPRYRTSGGRLITYFEYDFSEMKPHEIFAEIVLGPKSEVSLFDLSILLTEVELPSIPVHRSKASYR